MEVEYLLTRREYQHVIQRVTLSAPGNRMSLKILPLFVAVMSLALLTLQSIPFAISLPASIITALILFAMMPTLLRIRGGKIYDIQSKTPSWCEYTLRLEPEFLYFKTAMVKSELRWEAVTRIAEDELGFFMYISPIQAYFIPRRAFVNAAEAQQFWTLAQSYYQHARKAPASVTA